MSRIVELVVPTDADIEGAEPGPTEEIEVDEEAGFALLCTALPREDCRIEVDAYAELLEHRAALDQPPRNAKLKD